MQGEPPEPQCRQPLAEAALVQLTACAISRALTACATHAERGRDAGLQVATPPAQHTIPRRVGTGLDPGLDPGRKHGQLIRGQPPGSPARPARPALRHCSAAPGRARSGGPSRSSRPSSRGQRLPAPARSPASAVPHAHPWFCSPPDAAPKPQSHKLHPRNRDPCHASPQSLVGTVNQNSQTSGIQHESGPGSRWYDTAHPLQRTRGQHCRKGQVFAIEDTAEKGCVRGLEKSTQTLAAVGEGGLGETVR